MTTSVILATLNERVEIARAIERAWRAGAHEVLVVDGGSDDGTVEIAAKARCQLLACRRGRGIQQNVGARQAAGDVLLFVHADNWLDEGTIGQMTEALARRGAGWGAFCQRIEAPGRIYRAIERGNEFRARRLALPYGDQGVFIRREMFFRAGGFPDEPLMEDLLLARRLRRIARPLILPGPIHVSARRWQQRGVIRQTVSNWLLASAALAGVAPHRLARFYPQCGSG